MRKQTKCSVGCSLRTRTLILLCIVMAGCGFHLCYLKFNQNQSASPHSKESSTTINPKNIPPEVDISNRSIRSKRSPDVLSDIGQKINDAAQLPGKIVNKAGERFKNAASSATSTFYNVTSGIKNKVGSAINQGSTYAYDTFASGITEDITKQITAHVLDQINKSGILDQTTNHLTGAMVGDIFDRVDERFEKFIKSSVRFIVRIYSMIGVGSSAVGIYGIHIDNPNCLTFSVFFFQFTILSEVLLMSEINVDLNMERKVSLLSELVRIDWKGLGIVEDPMMLVNAGILLMIAISFHFLMVVKKYQSAISKKNDKKEIINDDENPNNDIVRSV